MNDTSFIIEPKREIPVAARSDVLVIGGGPAGFSAAINAARQGCSVTLIEQAGSIGGIATIGLMSHWTGSTRGGFYEEIIERSIDCFKEDDKVIGSWTTINPEKLKTVLLEMIEEEGIDLRLYTFASGVVMERDGISAVITESKSGRQAFIAKIVIDASGDGDVAARAGVPFHKGRETDGKMQPVTLMFKVAGVDMEKAVLPGAFEDNRKVPKGEIQTLGKQHIPYPAGHVLLYPSTLQGIVTVNMTNAIDIDGTRAEDLTKAEITCRKQIDPIVKFLREFVPGFENCYVISSASMMGVRETRHFEGEYVLTEDDILNAKVFDDWAVTKAHFNFDVHNIKGAGLDDTGVQKKFPQGKPYTIPYRCLVPKKVDNLLLAGRNISGTHMAHSNYRVMPICANIGQAAGIAAALCVKRGKNPRNLDVKALQDALANQGVEP
ncbi:MAG: FAD-dependent oxidoreductase [Candidatus Hodarchaeota archaeon]